MTIGVRPSEPRTLYHYCPTASFHAIIESHSVWLSSLALSNDTTEGKHVTQTITRLAARDSMDQSSVRKLQKVLGIFDNIMDGLGFCLSEDGDLLSQWRGYAANATGVAIGFSTEYLEWLPGELWAKSSLGYQLRQVEYGPVAHEECIAPVYYKLKLHIEEGAFQTPGKRPLADSRTDEEIKNADERIAAASLSLRDTASPLWKELFRLKAYAFREEREWRLLSYLFGEEKDTCSHRVMHDRMVPYQSIPLLNLERKPITEIILGPKHGTPPRVVQSFLKRNGYGVVKVLQSEASYR
jgi:hypothetical protein